VLGRPGLTPSAALDFMPPSGTLLHGNGGGGHGRIERCCGVEECTVSPAAADDELVALLARATVERAAPEELPLFRATSAAYFQDPAALERQQAKDDMLGFGPGAAVVLLTPVALTVSREVLQFLREQVSKYAREEGEGAVKRLLDRLVKGKPKEEEAAAGGASPPAAAPPELSDEQLKEVRRVALEKARQLRLSEEKAGLLADSLVGALATA
jgi:hypothetical protein